VFVNQITRPLDLPIPAGIMVVDIGNGIKEHANQKRIGLDDIHSTPFAAILKGMLHPGVWHDTSMTVGFRDLMNSILTVPTDLLSGQFTGHNVAIISENYVNLCFRFGYHFNIIDAYSHDIERNNHIYFRFLGGATDITKRSRRADLISRILKSFDFNIQIKGDLVIARIHNLFKSEIERILEMLGRLVGFTRQLDVKLTDDIIVGRYADAFLREDYSIISS
jgi:pyruvate,water dikinase